MTQRHDEADPIAPEVLARFLASETTDQETRLVGQWLDANPEARLSIEAVPGVRRPDTGAFLSELSTRIDEQLPDSTRAIGAQFTEPSDTPISPPVPSRIASSSDRTPESQRIRRHDTRLPNRRTPILRLSPWPSRVAAVFVLFAIGAGLWYSQTNTADKITANLVYETDSGERLKIRLADGTEIELNVASRLELSNDFGDRERHVQLDGQAFFNVASDTSRPFVIDARDTKVRVLGTAFDVKAYDDLDRTTVAVAEGRVQMQGSQSEESGVVLTQGQLGELLTGPNKQAGISVSVIDPSIHFGWRSGVLQFVDAPLGDVGRTIGRWYNVDVETSDSVNRLRLDATFDNESLESVMERIGQVLDIVYDLDGSRLSISARS